MRVSLLLFFVLVPMMCLNAQNWNPYVTKESVSLAPLLPMELKGNAVLLFYVGNDGNEPLKLVKNQEMTIVISLSNGIPNHVDPQLSITGSWEDKFDWSYQKSYNTFLGVQNQEIQAASEGTIGIIYKATKNSRKSMPSNGVNVNIQPPPYSNGVNLTDDDSVSVYTYVSAKDYGDAPLSYGKVCHQINSFKISGTNQYENYLYFGQVVDAEPDYQESAKATGDDTNLINDEDGVIFPELLQGDTVDIEVFVTVHDKGVGILNAWFDWNGDGDFDEENEIIESPINVFKTGKKIISVTIPDDAITSESTYARFRLGDVNVESPTIESAFGEVEDYQINIEPAARMEISNIYLENPNKDKSGSVSLNDIVSCSVSIKNTGTTILNNIIIKSSKIKFNNNVRRNLSPDDSIEFQGFYKISSIDLNQKELTTIITADSDETEPISEKLLIYSSIK